MSMQQKIPNAISLKAKELAAELGADAVVVVTLRPTEDGGGWVAHHAAYMDGGSGLDWETVSRAVRDAGEEMDGEPVIELPEPS